MSRAVGFSLSLLLVLLRLTLAAQDVASFEKKTHIQKLANGFVAGGVALDGVVEAVEFTGENWFAMGVQWQPASGTASGLDIQVFRTGG